MIQTFDGIKQQLWDYYKQLTERAVEVGEEVVVVDPLLGPIGTTFFIPIGLRDEIAYTSKELEIWMRLEKAEKEAKKGL